jgi:hypothetical protein
LDILFDSEPPNENMVDDILQIIIHRAWERDIFVTIDNILLNSREQLNKLGVIVCRPEEAVRRVRDRIASSP